MQIGTNGLRANGMKLCGSGGQGQIGTNGLRANGMKLCGSGGQGQRLKSRGDEICHKNSCQQDISRAVQ